MTQMINFSEITEIGEVERVASQIIKICHDSKGLNKSSINKVLNSIRLNLIDEQSNIDSKFTSILLLKVLTDMGQIKILSVLSNSQLFSFLLQQAQLIDPFKKMEDKGRNILQMDQQNGNNWITLILQLIVYWGERFQRTKKGEQTKFKKGLAKLQNNKVILPTSYRFITKKIQTAQGKENISNISEDNSIKIYFHLIKNKIVNLIQVLHDTSPKDLQNQINYYHQSFQNDLVKLNTCKDQALYQDEQINQEYLLILSFLNSENQFYHQYILTNNYPIYIRNLISRYQQIFGQADEKFMQNSQEDFIKKQNDQDNFHSVKKSIFYRESKSSSFKNQVNVHQRKNNFINQQSSTDILGCLNKIATKTSVSSGFRSIKCNCRSHLESLQRQCSLFKTQNPGRKTKSNNKSNKDNNFSFQMKDKVQQPIPYQLDNFQGIIVKSNQKLIEQFNMVKHQNNRFRRSHFKNHSKLFENQFIQIGFKSQCINESECQIKPIVNINLYIGNKLQNQITNIKVQFIANEDFVIYASSKLTTQNITPKIQVKYSLLIIPKQIPFGSLSFKLYYTVNAKILSETLFVPISLNKLATNYTIQRQKFQQNWQNCCKILKTPMFRLSQKFKQYSLIKLFEKFSQYRRNKHQDYYNTQKQEFCVIEGLVVLIGEIEFLLRVNIIKKQNIVIQIATINQLTDFSSVCIQTYIQTLEALLSRNRY